MGRRHRKHRKRRRQLREQLISGINMPMGFPLSYNDMPGRGIRLHYSYGRDWSSSAIGIFSADRLSHVDAVLPDALCDRLTYARRAQNPHGYAYGSLMGARYDAIGGRPPGVQIRPPGYEKWRRVVLYETPCTENQAKHFWNFMLAQEGKSYDWTAVLAFAVNRDWRDPQRWFCSELISAAQEDAQIIPKVFMSVNKVTPASSALIQSTRDGVLLHDGP
jgi:hypothetical protein